MWIIVSIVAAAVVLMGYVLLSWFGRWRKHRGATPEEFDMPLISNQWLEGGPRVRVRMTRAVWVEAPPEHV